MEIYVVRQGDTLGQIAQKYNVNIPQIVAVNELEDSNQLVPGEALVIPTSTRSYTVQYGDTLWSIAQKTGSTVQALIQMNGLTDPNTISPGMTLTIPSHGQKPLIETNGFIYDLDSHGVNAVRQVSEHLTYLAPFAYGIKEDGGLTALGDTDVIREGLNHGAVPMMSISNFTSQELGSDLAHTLLISEDLQQKLFEAIISIAKQKAYQGVNIDFENVYPYDRGSYNQFLERAVRRLHDAGLFVSTSLAPKTSASQQGLLYEAHDYPAHGRIVDFVVLMTYEWGYRFGPPQAISPLNRIRQVIDYAVTVIPRNKIMMGFQVYARDWRIPHVQGQEAETFSPKEARERALQYQSTIQYDHKAQSPFFQYTDQQGQRHEVWFEDARSAQAKFDLVKSAHLRGISYWVLGYPYPENWTLLEDNFTIRKRL
ncbi:spore germination protein [Pullulanibacillus pueri]|uniref:Spore germination protein YaaH n=1 Tax=Pullulanibacillus pueri TaxID=1437324 RepID=A0A8J3ENN3_9BACL|nr:LysM peptidoglycan-binding domain-containing protein [Pullulanibacillus pueri]MBM7684019.1 spore germination protein [Pullulanibacillus pueri]GGH85069.1 spore germination protein YaaH [Pullulanibacillus pueri]